MSVIYLMIPAALLLAALGVGAFIIAAKKGQFDDLDTPALRAVLTTTKPQPSTKKKQASPQRMTPETSMERRRFELPTFRLRTERSTS
tara:strand:- start:19745 stop:20008 length:264 start_codon:yes stop_codon:yes gene_type:complete